MILGSDPNDHAKRVDACNTKDGRYKCLVFENPQREKLGTLGRVPDIYTNIYHIYDHIWVIYWLYRAIWCNVSGTTARVPSQWYPNFPFETRAPILFQLTFFGRPICA